MKGFEQGNDWLKFWSENQKSLFQAWVEGKPPPFAFRGEPPPAGDPLKQADQLSDLMRETMSQWATLAKDAWTQSGRFDALVETSTLAPARLIKLHQTRHIRSRGRAAEGMFHQR